MRIEVVDSHTGGEPTRVIVGGMPELRGNTVAERLNDFRERYDHIRSGVVCEPRGSDVLVGALLLESTHPHCDLGMLFFNNAGYLGMCGHGTIGVVETLKHLGRLPGNQIKIETPVGVIDVKVEADGGVSLQNVPAYRFATDISIEVPGYGHVSGDVAWGGNWFYLVKHTSFEVPALVVSNAVQLVALTTAIKQCLSDSQVYGSEGAIIDHVELFSAAVDADNHSRNFVLCPGNAYDRSPCGTGTSAKMACLAADNRLAPTERWRQESITGSVFEGWFDELESGIAPHILGRAFVTGESTLLFDAEDPFCWGFS